MLDLKDFSFFENQSTFDFKGFALKVAAHWKWILACLLLALFIAYQINVRKEKIYALDSLIVVKDENSTLFSSNTSLVFNWGGTSEKVQAISTTIKSRSHNELVVSKLKYYIQYLKQGDYGYIDAYGKVPFYIDLNLNSNQILNHIVKIKFIDQLSYELRIEFDEDKISTYNYSTEIIDNINVEKGEIAKKYKIGQNVDLPFLKFKLELNPGVISYVGKEYYFKLEEFNSVVSRYRDITVEPVSKNGGSILKLQLIGPNKARIVDYLNTTVEVLRKNQLESKNLFAVNTIAFIDSTLAAMENELSRISDEMEDFRKNKKVYELEAGGKTLVDKLELLNIEKDGVNRKLQYYNSLEKYLKNSNDFSSLPAPTVAGIDDPNIQANVSRLIQLSVERSSMVYGVKSEKLYGQNDKDMEALKLVTLNNIISAKESLNYDLNLISSKIQELDFELKKLPQDQQDYLKISGKYNLSQSLYSIFLSKRSEANILKASSVSDVQFIDPAKDIGKGLIGPNTTINYILAVLFGVLIPLLIILTVTLFDNSINNSSDVQRLTKIPILGVVGKNFSNSNLAVFDKPKSALAESFRAIRSSLQFFYKKKSIDGAKTLMLTSSISGEGKTFCSINIATVFALSEKKTIIVGLDLRKPKISSDFNVDSSIGVVNYLVGDKTLDEVIQKTSIPSLDVLVSGPVPPNPSELIMSEAMITLLNELKSKYDYIILDTPPIGLVSDALELVDYCDAVLYVVRQSVTKQQMLSLVNDKHKKGELNNVSIILNGFDFRAKYGYGYGYGGYGYGYGYGNGYYVEDKPKRLLHKIRDFFKLNNK